jgi:transcription termination/antitermination protein NusG
MDDLNVANAEPAAALPPEASSGQVSSSAADLSPTNAPAEPGPLSVVEPLGGQATGASQSTSLPEATSPAATEEPRTERPAEEAKEQKQEEKKEAKAEEKQEEEKKSDKMDWYILKVQSNREESIREGLLRRVAIAGLGYYFGEVIVPTEKVTEFKGGKKKVIKRKLYPGYLVVHMEINDDTWFLVRETPGIGDFTGAAGRPSPMLPHEVSRIVAKQEEKSEKAPKLKIAFREGDRVKIKEGTFENFEGEVESIDETNGRVTVMINIFGRSTPVELEYWQIEAL